MERFIRTKDGRIAEIKDNMFVIQSDVLRLVYKDRPYICVLNGDDEIIKQADTIEELCDEFVYEKELYNRIEKGEDLENQTRIRLFDISFFDLYIEEWNDIYGAIWTDKGLIYVAKMNEKGEMELL